MSLVGSRALTLWGKKYMVPFADMYNYQPHAQTREADSGRHFLRYHKARCAPFPALRGSQSG